MAMNAALLREGMQRWAREQAHTLEAMQRALEIVYRDRPGSRSIDDLAHALLVAVANQHEGRLTSALGRMDDALARLMDDMDSLRTAVTEGRAPALREGDLHIVADALGEMSKFEDRVRFMLEADPESLRDTMRFVMTPAAPVAAAVASSGPGRVGRGRRAVAALADAVEVPPLISSQGRGADLLGLADTIERARAQGRTLEPIGAAPVRVTWPDHPVLAEQMHRMRAAADAYRAAMAAAPTPAAAARAVDDLQRVVAESNETLRSFGERFTSATTGDRLPPGRPISPGTAHLPGSTTADALNVRARVGALAGPSATHTEVSDALRFSDLTATATGELGEPLARTLPGLGLEGYTLGGSGIRRLGTGPDWLAGRLADMVAGWQRAHLVGPGFGGEVFAGLMLAPWGVNQLAQNKGVEHILRQMTTGQRARGVAGVAPVITARGRRLAIPLANGAFEFVDLLASVHYEIPRPGNTPLHVDIHVNPDGSWRVTHDLPAGVWPVDVPLTGTR